MNYFIIIFILASLMILTFITFCLIELIKIIKEEKRRKSMSFKKEDLFYPDFISNLKKEAEEIKINEINSFLNSLKQEIK